MRVILKSFLAVLLLSSGINISYAATATCPDIQTAINEVAQLTTLSSPVQLSGGGFWYANKVSLNNAIINYYTQNKPTQVDPVTQVKSLAPAFTEGTLQTTTDGSVSCVYLGTMSGTAAPYTPNFTSRWNQVIQIITSGSTPPPPGEQVAVSTDVEGLPSGATVSVTMTNTAGGTPVQKTVNTGVASFATLTAGSYTVDASHYTSGSDTYYPTLINPYTIDAQHATVTINYTTTPPTPPTASMWFAPFKDFTIDVNWTTTPATPNLIPTEQGSGAKNYILAFIVSDQFATNKCTASWGGNPVASTSMGIGWGVDSIKQLRALGGDVGISFGGENGVTLASACTSVDDLYAIYKSAVVTYNPAILDFDIEGAAAGDTAANTRRFQALLKLQQDYPNLKISLTLSTDISGMSALHLAQEAHSLGLNIAYYNLMTMAWYAGKIPGEPIYKSIEAAVDSATTQLAGVYTDKNAAQLHSMIRTTARLGIDYDLSQFLLTDISPLVTAAKAGSWGGLAYWSMDVDSNSYCDPAKVGKAQATCTGTTSTPYAYTKAFLAAIASSENFDIQSPKQSQ